MGKRGRAQITSARWRAPAGVAAAGIALLAAAAPSLLLVGRPGAPPGPATPMPTVAPAARYEWQPDASPVPDTPLPAFATKDPSVARLYRFALERPDLLSYIPCTCGCAGDGHYSNWNCYIQRVEADGSVVFDDMAPG